MTTTEETTTSTQPPMDVLMPPGSVWRWKGAHDDHEDILVVAIDGTRAVTRRVHDFAPAGRGYYGVTYYEYTTSFVHSYEMHHFDGHQNPLTAAGS